MEALRDEGGGKVSETRLDRGRAALDAASGFGTDEEYLSARRELESAVWEAAIETAALCVLEDRPFSGLGIAASIRALKMEAEK